MKSLYLQYKEYLEALFAPKDVICFAFIREENGKRDVHHEFIHAEQAFTEKNFAELQETNKAFNVYVAMNPFRPELIGANAGRTKENVAEVKRLYAEVDIDGETVRDRILSSTITPPPSVVLESSPNKFQFIWNVGGLTQETAERLLKAISQEFRTDPAVAEIARVLRVPGLRNLKYPDKPEVKVIGDIDGCNFDRVDFQFQTKPVESKLEILRNAENLVKVGQIHYFMLSISGKLRSVGLTASEIEPILRRRVNEECETPPGGFDDAKIVAMARSMEKYEPGTSIDLILNQQPNAVAPMGQMANKPDVSNWPSMFRSVEEMEDGPIVMVIEGVLQEGTCFIGANPGDGKSLIGLAFAKSICTGTPLFGLPQFSVKEPRTVIYLIPESRDRAFRKRCEAFRMPTDKMKFMARTISAGMSLELSDPYLLEAVRLTKPVVFLDTASRFMKSSDENAAAQNRQLVNDVILLLATGAVCIVLIHHATKAARANQERMTLENMLRGTSDFGAMCDQAYGIRKDLTLYDNGDGPMEIDLVSLKDREQIGGLTNLRLAASHKNKDEDFVISYINETGNFKVVNNAETRKRELDKLVQLVESDGNIPAKDLAQQTGLTEYGVKHRLGALGWHRVQGGSGGASPWHQDNGGPCPFLNTAKKPGPPKPGLAEAIQYLKGLLARTPVSEADVFRGADQRGLTDAVIGRAKKRLGIVVGQNKEWCLPGTPEPEPAEATVN